MTEQTFSYPLKFYALRDGTSSERAKCASGGIATALGRFIIGKGGCVFGTGWNKDFAAETFCADNLDELEAFKGSRYVQGHIASSIYDEVEERVKKGPVLFIGTPCQISAINSRFPDGCDRLMTVDLICHGTPPASAFESELRHLKKCHRIRTFDDIRFRGNDQSDFKLSIWNKGRCLLCRSAYIQPYFAGFLLSVNLRESCYHCPFARPERISDITLGDYIVKNPFAPFVNKDGNISCMSANTDKGLALVNEFLKSSDTIEAYERDYCERLEYAPALREPARRNELSSKYAELIKKFPPAMAIRLTLFPVLLSRKISLLKVRIKEIFRTSVPSRS